MPLLSQSDLGERKEKLLVIHKHLKRRPEVSKMVWTLNSETISGGEGRLTFYLLDPHFPGDEQDRDIVENTVNLFQ